MPQALCQFTCA